MNSSDSVIQMHLYAQGLSRAYTDLQKSRHEIERAYIDTIHRLALAVEYKDENTGAHVARLSRYSSLLAELIGEDAAFQRRILFASPMHDVGKIGIPDNILHKPNRLTQEEFAVMKTHSTIGANLLANSNSAIIRMGESIAATHHERWDGTGYPNGLAGEDIPLAGRIVAVTDVYDALISQRPYKEIFTQDQALAIMRKGRGSHFEPNMLDCFLDNIDKFTALQEELHARRAEKGDD